MPGYVRVARTEGRSGVPAAAKQASQKEHLFLLWKAPQPSRMEPGRSKLPRGQETGGARLVRCGSHPLDFLDYWYKNLPHPLICIRGKARHFSFLDD